MFKLPFSAVEQYDSNDPAKGTKEMSPDNVTSLPKEAFRKKLKALAALHPVPDADFADAVYAAQSQFGVEESSFRATFGLTQGAVERWTMCKNLPQPSVRPAILEWIAGQL
jgi:hypothetical protein